MDNMGILFAAAGLHCMYVPNMHVLRCLHMHPADLKPPSPVPIVIPLEADKFTDLMVFLFSLGVARPEQMCISVSFQF